MQNSHDIFLSNPRCVSALRVSRRCICLDPMDLQNVLATRKPADWQSLLPERAADAPGGWAAGPDRPPGCYPGVAWPSMPRHRWPGRSSPLPRRPTPWLGLPAQCKRPWSSLVVFPMAQVPQARKKIAQRFSTGFVEHKAAMSRWEGRVDAYPVYLYWYPPILRLSSAARYACSDRSRALSSSEYTSAFRRLLPPARSATSF